MSVAVVGQRLVCSECTVTRCFESNQRPGDFEASQQHFLTVLEAFELEHLHGAPRPERLTRAAVRPHPRVPVNLIVRKGAA